MNYDKAFGDLMDLECGFGIRKAPFGVEAKYYDIWCVKKNLPHTDISLLSESQAKLYAYEEYWLKMNCEHLPDRVDFAVFQAGYNCGQQRVIGWLQRIVGVSIDGVPGPETISAVGNFDKNLLIYSFLKEQDAYYKSIDTARNHKYIDGWHHRVVETAQLIDFNLKNYKTNTVTSSVIPPTVVNTEPTTNVVPEPVTPEENKQIEEEILQTLSQKEIPMNVSKNLDWRHYSGLLAIAGAVGIALYEQFGGAKIVLVHDMVIIKDFCFTYSGIMFGHVMNDQKKAS